MWQLTDAKAREFDKLVRTGVSLVRDHGVHILTINELGFPGNKPPAPRSRSALSMFEDYFRSLTRRRVVRATDGPFYALLGSMHCLTEMTNTMPIYYFAGRPPRSRHQPIFQCTPYYKKTAAFRICEFTNIPSVRQLSCLKIGEISILPLICLDLYDTTQMLSIIYRNLLCDFYGTVARDANEAARVDVVVVNSLGMTAHDELDDTLRAFSRMAGVVVVLASSTKRDAFSRGYYLGEEFPVLRAKARRVVSSKRPRFRQELEDHFSLYSFRVESFRDDIKQVPSYEARSEIANLFQLRRTVGL